MANKPSTKDGELKDLFEWAATSGSPAKDKLLDRWDDKHIFASRAEQIQLALDQENVLPVRKVSEHTYIVWWACHKLINPIINSPAVSFGDQQLVLLYKANILVNIINFLLLIIFWTVIAPEIIIIERFGPQIWICFCKGSYTKPKNIRSWYQPKEAESGRIPCDRLEALAKKRGFRTEGQRPVQMKKLTVNSNL